MLDRATWQDLSPLLATPDKFGRTGGTYPLTSLNGGTSTCLREYLYGATVCLDGVSYVSLTDARHEWVVIATYQRGERFEDQCYSRTIGR